MIYPSDYGSFDYGELPPPPVMDHVREEQILAEIRAASEQRRRADEIRRSKELEEEIDRQKRIDDEHRAKHIDFFA